MDKHWVKILGSAFLIMTIAAAGGSARAESAAGNAASITVIGSAEVAVAPDRAVVRLGAMIQSNKAADALQQVNQIMQRVLRAIKNLNISDQYIQTSGLSLLPVYARQTEVSRVAAYRASNIVIVQVDDLNRVGDVIDAGIHAGANQLRGISFDIRDAGKYRRKALQIAACKARAKAEALASAMPVKLGQILEIREQGSHIVRPPTDRFYAAAAKAATPVQPGQIQIRASVTVRFQIGGRE